MTPAARISAAIDVIDTINSGQPAEQALTNWARGNRYAGSGDRAAIRDHVFDVLRRKRSCAALGGGEDGRALMLGLLAQTGVAPETLFTGDRFAPAPLSAAEVATLSDPPTLDAGQKVDLPDWLLAPCQDALPTQELALLRDRAPLFLRVNLSQITRDDAALALAEAGFTAIAHPLSPSALRVEGHPRGLKALPLFHNGLIELQDAASQAATDMVPVEEGAHVLDYCAGGGGKLLALAGRCDARFVAHDADPARMSDLPARAARAGVSVRVADTQDLPDLAPFDTVVCDVPCSGSGSWRRAPAGKWALSDAKLDWYRKTQAEILDAGAALCAENGRLAYMTCSVLRAENEVQLDDFSTRHPSWTVARSRRFFPSEGGDGFFAAILERK